jgi:hypothetical protein
MVGVKGVGVKMVGVKGVGVKGVGINGVGVKRVGVKGLCAGKLSITIASSRAINKILPILYTIILMPAKMYKYMCIYILINIRTFLYISYYI